MILLSSLFKSPTLLNSSVTSDAKFDAIVKLKYKEIIDKTALRMPPLRPRTKKTIPNSPK